MQGSGCLDPRPLNPELVKAVLGGDGKFVHEVPCPSLMKRWWPTLLVPGYSPAPPSSRRLALIKLVPG